MFFICLSARRAALSGLAFGLTALRRIASAVQVSSTFLNRIAALIVPGDRYQVGRYVSKPFNLTLLATLPLANADWLLGRALLFGANRRLRRAGAFA